MDGIEGYLQHLRAAGRAPGTVRLRGYQLRGFAAWCPVPLGDASSEHVAAWLGRAMAAETRASQRAALTGYFRWAGVVSPVAGLPPAHRPQGVPRPCPDSVTAAALASADPATAAAITLARFAGLRAAEVAAVNGADVDGDCLRVVGKGGRVRCVPIHPAVADVLPAAGYVFPAARGGHWRAGTITHRVAAALSGPWTCHSLRHAFATEVYRVSGHDLRLVQQLLGHSSPRTTARYVLVDDEHARVVVAGLTLAA